VDLKTIEVVGIVLLRTWKKSRCLF